MGNYDKRIRKMNRKGLDRMQTRAGRKMKGMTWKGWLDDNGAWMGSWRYTVAHKPSDRRALGEYADTAPFRWHVLAVVRCQTKDAHGKVESYDEEVGAATGQALTKEELADLARDLLRQAHAKVNTKQIVIEFFTLTPLV